MVLRFACKSITHTIKYINVFLSHECRPQKELPDEAENSLPPSKIPRTDTSPSPTTFTPSTPPSKVKPDILTPSPEQKERMESNKLEAESKMIAKKFGADKIGLSWMKALHSEFKKPYISTVTPIQVF